MLNTLLHINVKDLEIVLPTALLCISFSLSHCSLSFSFVCYIQILRFLVDRYTSFFGLFISLWYVFLLIYFFFFSLCRLTILQLIFLFGCFVCVHKNNREKIHITDGIDITYRKREMYVWLWIFIYFLLWNTILVVHLVLISQTIQRIMQRPKKEQKCCKNYILWYSWELNVCIEDWTLGSKKNNNNNNKASVIGK